MTEAPERIVTSKCGKTLVHDGMKRFETDVQYIRADRVDALEAQASAQGFDRGVKEAQPIVESLRAELQSLYDAIGFDPLDLENGHGNARQALDALLKAEREKALREAAECAAEMHRQIYNDIPPREFTDLEVCDEIKRDIFALISEDATDG